MSLYGGELIRQDQLHYDVSQLSGFDALSDFDSDPQQPFGQGMQFCPTPLQPDYAPHFAARSTLSQAQTQEPSSTSAEATTVPVRPAPAKVAKTAKKDKASSGSTYASRHQAAESRRRQRINDRCAVLLHALCGHNSTRARSGELGARDRTFAHAHVLPVRARVHIKSA